MVGPAAASAGPAAASAGPAAAAAPPEEATEEATQPAEATPAEEATQPAEATPAEEATQPAEATPAEEATQPAEATPAEEVLRQSSAIVSADPELNRVVAAMQPAAGLPTATDTWLLQLGAVPQLDARGLAVSVGRVVSALRDHAEQLRSAIVEPFVQFWRSRLSWEHVSEIGLFGARHYQLPLGTSDFDVVCHLRPGCSRKRHFEKVLAIIAADPEGAFTQVPSAVTYGNTLQCKWRGIWVDFKASYGERALDSACRSSDLMKVPALPSPSRSLLPRFL